MAYSDVTDMLTADLAFSRNLDKQKFVDDAADEIDSIIGERYVTPVNIGAGGTVARHSALLLKRVNVFLSTGRMILAVAAPNEQNSLQAYGRSLVRDALGVLEGIRRGTIDLDGAPLMDDGDIGSPMPRIVNRDAVSAVEAFEDRFMQHGIPGEYVPMAPTWTPGGGV